MAALLTCASYQCKRHVTLIALQTLSTLTICVSYLFLDVWTGMALNVVCIIRNFVIWRKDIKLFSSPAWRYILALAMALAGALSWQGAMSLLVIAALAVNTLFLYSPDLQRLRVSILFTSSAMIAYNVCYSVWGGVANEALAIASAVVGLYRCRGTKAKE